MLRHVLLLLSALAIWACASEREQVATLTVSTDTVAGVVHVSNEGVPEHWIAHRAFAVGSAESDVQFGRIMSIAADADGFVYVADGLASRVWVFDSTGTPIMAFGREGEGPGEFRNLYSVALLGDTLVTLDPGAARFGLFNRDGTWLGLWRHQSLHGDVRLEGVSHDEVYSPVVIPREQTIDRGYVRLTHAGPIDTITLPDRDERAESSDVTCLGADGGIHHKSNPFAGRELIRAAPGGHLLQMWTADYRLAMLDRDGDTVRVIERDRRPIAVPDSVWEAYFHEFRSWFANVPSPRCMGPSEPQRPTSYPAVREMALDPTGRIWIETHTAEGLAFDVFNLKGELIATMAAPERDPSVRPFARGDRFYVVSADELGVQRVDAFRVARR